MVDPKTPVVESKCCTRSVPSNSVCTPNFPVLSTTAKSRNGSVFTGCRVSNRQPYHCISKFQRYTNLPEGSKYQPKVSLPGVLMGEPGASEKGEVMEERW